jgi:hypothetical protein
MEPSTVVIIIFGVALIILTAFALVKVGAERDNELHWTLLMAEAERRFPNAMYRAKIEFMRRDRYAQIKLATERNEDITELTEDYNLLMDEEDRVTEGERQLGADFDPYVASQQKLQ